MKHSNFKRALCLIISAVMLVCCTLVNANAKTILRGDVNGDGQITADDARLALRAAATLEVLEGDALIAADVDESGDILAGDARTILRVSAVLEQFDDPNIVIEEETTTEAPETTTEAPETTTEAPETTTEAPETTTQAPETTTQDNKVSYPKAIDGLFENHYYMELEGDGATGGIAVSGEDAEFVASIDGMEMAVYMSKGDIYLKYDVKGLFGTTTKYYYKFDADSEMAEGFDTSDMLANYNFGKKEDYKEITSGKETLDGVEYTVYSFISENGTALCFFADKNDNIKALCSKDAEGNMNNDVAYIKVLTYDIPAGMCSIKGRINDLTMMGMMSFMEQNGFLDINKK